MQGVIISFQRGQGSTAAETNIVQHSQFIASEGSDTLQESNSELTSDVSDSEDDEVSDDSNHGGPRGYATTAANAPSMSTHSRGAMMLQTHGSCAEGQCIRFPSSSSSAPLSLKDTFSVLSEYKGSLKGTVNKQRDVHEALCSTTFCAFKCSCNTYANVSCLDDGFDRANFREMHVHTYGRAPDFHTLAQTKEAVHAAIWELRQPLPPPHVDGRLFSVPVWKLGGPTGKVVCKTAFIAATSGTIWAHREALTLTIAGKHPHDNN